MSKRWETHAFDAAMDARVSDALAAISDAEMTYVASGRSDSARRIRLGRVVNARMRRHPDQSEDAYISSEIWTQNPVRNEKAAVTDTSPDAMRATRDLVERTRSAQGLPLTITDRAALGAVAAIIRGARLKAVQQ